MVSVRVMLVLGLVLGSVLGLMLNRFHIQVRRLNRRFHLLRIFYDRVSVKSISHTSKKVESAISPFSNFYDFFFEKSRKKKQHKKSKKGEIGNLVFLLMCEINLSFICK